MEYSYTDTHTKKTKNLKKQKQGARVLAQGLGALAVLAEEQGSILGTRMVVYKYKSSCSLLTLWVPVIHVHRNTRKQNIHKIKINKSKIIKN